MNNGCVTRARKNNESKPDKTLDSASRLRQDRVDVLFRSYDLLFQSYPELRNALPDNRYMHPDLIALFDDKTCSNAVGIQAIVHLINLLDTNSRYETKKFLRVTRQNLLQAIEEVMCDTITESHMSDYKNILDQNLRRL